MLNLLNVKTLSKPLDSGDIMRYIPLPELLYSDLKTDFERAEHFSSIDNLNLMGVNGVLVKCHYEEDGILAATYIYKKFLAENYDYLEVEEDDFDVEYVAGIEPYDASSDEIEAGGYLPVFTSNEFNSSVIDSSPWSMETETPNAKLNHNVIDTLPCNTPLVIIKEDFDMSFSLESTTNNRFVIFIIVESDAGLVLMDQSYLELMQKKMLFESDYEYCQIEQAHPEYYEEVLDEIVKEKGYELSQEIDRKRLIQELKEYRGMNFASNNDIYALVEKAIRKKTNLTKTLSFQDFQNVFMISTAFSEVTASISRSAMSELDELIGLQDVKQQLKRIITRMKFNIARKKEGYRTSPIHFSAVFMGNPGTAKTTVARIFGKLLCEEGVLENTGFMEVTRKDLVGQYVGWTAPKVAKLFEDAEGGTLFIDEAYSLMSSGNDGYSSEAMAEIILQMENNPETLVIFAGYTDEMKNLILEANPGLRSRLTNLVQFNDYSLDEMVDIVKYLMQKEDYILADPAINEQQIRKFVVNVGGKNIGNGRMMRKFINAVVSYMAERPDNDMKTIIGDDIEKAVNEMVENERLLLNNNTNNIGFRF